MMNKKQKFIETGIKARLKNRGRSNKQIEGNYKVLGWTLFGFISFIVIVSIIHLLK